MTKTQGRNYGIDLLRILSIFCVVFLHLLGHGKVDEMFVSVPEFSIVWLIEALTLHVVDCYILISGFFGYRESKIYPKIKNIISLFFVVLFYSVVICLCFKLIFPTEVGISNVVESFFPIATTQYYFFNSYFAMFLVSPALNYFVYKADDKLLYITTIAIFIFATYDIFQDPFKLNGGNSFVWFALLYMLGAMIKKTDLAFKISNKKCLLFYISSALILWASKVILHFGNISVLGYAPSKIEHILFSSSSPFMLIMAVSLVCIFAKIETATVTNKVIAFFVPMVFSVYLIHDNFYIREYVVSKAFVFFNQYNPLFAFLLVLACALVIFVVCSLIDRVRMGIFKLLHIDSFSEKIEVFIKTIVTKTFAKLQSKK